MEVLRRFVVAMCMLVMACAGREELTVIAVVDGAAPAPGPVIPERLARATSGRLFTASGAAIVHEAEDALWIAIDPATLSGAREAVAHRLGADVEVARHPIQGSLIAVCPFGPSGAEGALLIDAHDEGNTLIGYHAAESRFVVIAEIAGQSYLGAVVEDDTRPCRTLSDGEHVLATISRARGPSDFSLVLGLDAIADAAAAGPCVSDDCLPVLRDPDGIESWVALMPGTTLLPAAPGTLEALSFVQGEFAAGGQGVARIRCDLSTLVCTELGREMQALTPWVAPLIAWRGFAVDGSLGMFLINGDERSGTILTIDAATLVVERSGVLSGSRPAGYVRLRGGPHPVIYTGRPEGGTLSSLTVTDEFVERRHPLPGLPVGPVAEGTGLGFVFEVEGVFRFYALTDLAEN